MLKFDLAEADVQSKKVFSKIVFAAVFHTVAELSIPKQTSWAKNLSQLV